MIEEIKLELLSKVKKDILDSINHSYIFNFSDIIDTAFHYAFEQGYSIGYLDGSEEELRDIRNISSSDNVE